MEDGRARRTTDARGHFRQAAHDAPWELVPVKVSEGPPRLPVALARLGTADYPFADPTTREML